jgi:hypothetical protein
MFPEKINWDGLSGNPSPVAIEMLKQISHEIEPEAFSKNPSIFTPNNSYILK